MQRANSKTPNANLLTKIEKCTLQQCSPPQVEEKDNFRKELDKELDNNSIKNVNRIDSIATSLAIEKEELNNNLIESKNANRNEKIDLVNRWSTTSIRSNASNELSTPIYLHHPPPSYNLSSVDNNQQSANSDDRFIKQNVDSKQLKRQSKTKISIKQQKLNEQTNENQIHSTENQLTANQMQLHQINAAEQRIERKLKQKSKKASSRLSSDSTSSDSTHEDERLNKDLPYPEYVRYSFNWFPQDSEWRLICLRMIANDWFERVSMTAILINCITLGMYHPCADEVCLRPKCKMLQMFDDIIYAFFALEMLIKMTAMGVRGTKNAYLSTPWNRLDFFIVISG